MGHFAGTAGDGSRVWNTASRGPLFVLYWLALIGSVTGVYVDGGVRGQVNIADNNRP
jgi:hypothetical protein